MLFILSCVILHASGGERMSDISETNLPTIADIRHIVADLFAAVAAVMVKVCVYGVLAANRVSYCALCFVFSAGLQLAWILFPPGQVQTFIKRL